MSDVGFEGMTAISQEFEYRGQWARQRSYSLALSFARRLIDEVRMNASGRPGPNVVTGDYLDSFWYEVTNMQIEGGGMGAGAEVGSTAPQAARLEYGFVGADSRGAHYEQPPFPHWGPAMDAVAPEYEAAMVTLVDFDVPVI